MRRYGAMNQPATPPGSGASNSAMTTVLVVWSVLLLLCSAGAALVIAKRYRDARRGWNLVPVVVVAADIPANGEVTMELLSQRSMPEQFVTESVVRPDEASRVITRRVRAKLVAGDPLLWRDLLPEQGAVPEAPKKEHAE